MEQSIESETIEIVESPDVVDTKPKTEDVENCENMDEIEEVEPLETQKNIDENISVEKMLDSPTRSENIEQREEEDVEDVTKMTNQELKERLSVLGISIGPIVASTRKLYEKKLYTLLVKGRELTYSTDEDVIPEPSVQPVLKPAETKKFVKTRRKEHIGDGDDGTASETIIENDLKVQEKFSDDEDEVTEESVTHRRSTRITQAKKNKEKNEEAGKNEHEQETEPYEAGDELEVEVVTESPTNDSGAEVKTAPPLPPIQTKSAPKIVKCTPKSYSHTLLFAILVLIASYLVYSERSTIQWAFQFYSKQLLERYTEFYYSMMPQIDTIIQPEGDVVEPTMTPDPIVEPITVTVGPGDEL